MSVKELSIVLLDHFDSFILDTVRKKLEKVFAIPTSIHSWESVSPSQRSDFRNGMKYRSTELINFFSEHLPAGMDKVLIITGDDLYSPVFARYFGEAQLNGRVGMVSAFFLKEHESVGGAPKLVFLSRMEKEMIHETGHLFGLKHCRDPYCVMKLSGKVSDIDIKSPFFCAKCSEALKYSTATD